MEDLGAFRGGEWSHAFAFRTAGRDLIARFGTDGSGYQKDLVAASWAQDGLALPEILKVGGAFDAAYAVSERVFGTPIEDLDGQGWTRVLPSLFRALDAMRRVQLPGRGFGRWTPDGSAPFGSWRDWLLSIDRDPLDARIAGWKDRLATVPPAGRWFEAGYDLLTRLVDACPEIRHVVHGDLTAGNVLVRDDRVSGVFDWANSVAGDPLYDFGWLTFWAPWHPGLDAVDVAARAREHFGDVDFDERVRCYAVHVGLDAQQYNAFTSRWDLLERTGKRTLEVGGT